MRAYDCCRYSNFFDLYLLHTLFFGLVIGICVAPPAWAVDAQKIQVHGFASQAYTLTNKNNFFGESTGKGSLEATELGINTSWRALPEVQLSGQLLWRKAGNIGNEKIQLDYGFVDYRFFSNEQHHHGVRFGRIKNPLGLYNDTRDVAFIRPGVILPQSIYFERTRDLALSSDGGELYGELRFSANTLGWELMIAQPRTHDVDTEIALLGADRLGNLQGDASFIGRLIYDYYGGRVRLAISSARLNLEYQPGSGDPSGSGAIRFTPVIFSGQFNSEKWTLTSEYARRHFLFGDNIIYVPLTLKKITGQSYYLQGSYRLTDKWGLMIRYDVAYQNIDDKTGGKLEAQTAGTLPGYSQFSKDWTIGARWQPSPAWMVRAEQHWINGTAWLPFQDNPDRTKTYQHWRLFTVLVSYRF